MRGSVRLGLVVGCGVIAVAGCKSKAKVQPTPPESTTVSAPGGGRASVKDDFKPAHAGHVNQRDAKGAFVAARPPPPVVAAAAMQGATFDTKPPPMTKVAVPKATNGHCGEVDIGNGKKILLDCMTEDYAKVKSAATPLVRNDDLMGGAAPVKLPPLVDHRKDGTEGPVLDQQQTLACTSFSLVAAVNHSIARYLGHPGNLSPMHSWARYHTPRMTVADEVNVGHGLADFGLMPFDEKLANAWQAGKSPVDGALLAKADSKASVQITNITHVPTVGDIKSALAAGQDVWFALRAAHTLTKTTKNSHGAAIVPDYDYKAMPASDAIGHAILLSGYQETSGGTYYLIHNSWGTGWGENGYAWIHDTTLARNISDAYVVEAHPAEPAADAKVQPAVHKFMSCAADTAPDGITSQCVPKCADKGPRVNGVCPAPGTCPPGQTNLHGTCQPAAPVLDKTVSGIHIQCGESGCTYVVPNGKEGCTSASGCAVSCPSPRFKIANGPHGLACTG